MDTHTDIHLARGDTSQNTLAGSLPVDHENEPGDIALGGDSAPDNFDLSGPCVHSSPVTDGGNIEVHGRQSSVSPFKSGQEPSDIQMTGNRTEYEHGRIHTRSNSDQAILPVNTEEIPSSECVVVPAGGPISVINTNDLKICAIVYPQDLSLLHASTVSAAALHEDREGDLDESLNCIQMLPTEPDHVHTASLARLTDEEETREGFDYPCEDFLSLPPSSSPPQLFSSSPCASSQSSAGGIEPPKMVLDVEVEGCASSHDCPCDNYVGLVARDESRSENPHSHDNADIAASPEIDESHSPMGPTSCIEGGPGSSGKRNYHQSDPDESYRSQPIKRPKLDSCVHLPPAPRRATLASQHRQFRKLTAPFRPPLKLPAATDGLAETMNTREAEPIVSVTLETSHNKIDLKQSTAHLLPLRHKATNASRSATQFKSPLVNRALPADSRAIRLTPALQALERKLQLLKRAIKVKEDKEEVVLVRLAEKWMEAGREVAYDVWDATKDAGDFEGKTTLARGPHGWDGTNNGNTPWGWDTKLGDAGEESCDPDPSMTPCTVGRLTAEEDDDIASSTLGTMLRQLGIAPEIFGWDDNKETFSDENV